MTDTLTIAVVSFILGAVFIEIAKKYIKRPKGYVRINNKVYGEHEISEKRTTKRSSGPSAIRSKFDYLFNYSSKKDAPKVDLADVEKSFQPDPKPVSQIGSGELQNRYLDLSQVASNSTQSTETPSGQAQYTPYTPPPQNTASPQFTQNTGYTPPIQPTAPPAFEPAAQTPFEPAAQPPIQPAAQTPPVGDTTPKKDEKEHEWKPMGFFDD